MVANAMKWAFVAVLLMVGNCRAQDSLFVGTIQTDSLTDTIIDCYPWQCSPVVSHTYIIANNYIGAIDIYGEGLAEVLIMTESYVHFDTCAYLTQWAGAELRLLYQLTLGSRIVINSFEGQVVTVHSKVDTTVTSNFPPPFIDTDTLCPVGIVPAIRNEPAYYDLERLGLPVLQKDLLPNRRYKLINPK